MDFIQTYDVGKMKEELEKCKKKHVKIFVSENIQTEDEKYKISEFQKYIEDELLFSFMPKDIYISTMTISCKIDNIEFNCENISKYVDLSYDGIEDIICAIGEGRKDTKDEKNVIYRSLQTERNDKKEKKRKKVFYNQASMHLKIKTKKNDAVHVKLFSNGALHITGCQTCYDVTETLTSIINKLKRDKYVVDKTNGELVLRHFVNDKKLLDISLVSGLKVNMINTNFTIPFCVNLKNLYELLLSENKECRYDKINHSCVNIKYEHPEKEISIFVFEKGSIVITGAKTGEQINCAYVFINKFVYSNYKKIVKREINVKEKIDKVMEMTKI
jgi:TATA-box binding protein (TBP) (component of TFIID and TFIIIB)